jgi:hypothetical protein
MNERNRLREEGGKGKGCRINGGKREAAVDVT